MFKKLMKVLKGGDLVNQALNDTLVMLEKAKLLITVSMSSLVENKNPDFDIYKVDREINSLEKTIRRKVLEHLSINPSQDIVASLVLTSIVISIERIGDYSKNIYELKEFYNDDEEIKIDETLLKSAEFIIGIFDRVENAFKTEDASDADQLMNQINPIKKSFDRFISETAIKPGQSIRCIIVNVLLSRYLKRVAAHLENITSSIANPFDMIGFYKGEQNKEAD